LIATGLLLLSLYLFFLSFFFFFFVWCRLWSGIWLLGYLVFDSCLNISFFINYCNYFAVAYILSLLTTKGSNNMNETTYIEKFLPLMEVITDKLAISPNGTIVINGVAGYFESAEWFWFTLYNELREYMEKGITK